jgi:hypothetical protein
MNLFTGVMSTKLDADAAGDATGWLVPETGVDGVDATELRVDAGASTTGVLGFVSADVLVPGVSAPWPPHAASTTKVPMAMLSHEISMLDRINISPLLF